MSALGQKQTCAVHSANVREVPIADMRRQPLRGSKLGDANFKWQWAGAAVEEEVAHPVIAVINFPGVQGSPLLTRERALGRRSRGFFIFEGDLCRGVDSLNTHQRS